MPVVGYLHTGPNAGVSIFPVALGVVAAVFLGLAVLVGILVIVVVANRAEPDESGQRPLAVYLFGVSFVAVFAALFSSFAIVFGLVQLMGSHGPGPSPFGFTPVAHPVGDAVARVVVLAGLVLAVSLTLLLTHVQRGLALPQWAERLPGPVSRVVRSYVSAVCFLAIVIAAASVVVLVYQVFRILGPGVFQLGGSRVEAARTLIAAFYLAVAAVVVVVTHMRILPNGPFGSLARPFTGAGPTAPGAPGSPPPPITPPPATP
jgi:hypothetical protein